MAKGRKRKSGIRTKSGQLSRAGRASYDKGSDWVQQRRERFGEYYNSAIGRAYAAGLLGEGNEAKGRLDKARRFVALYGAVIGRDRYRCALNQSPRGLSHDHDPDQQAIDNQEWLIVNMARIDLTGCRPFFDQLADIGRRFTDYGPPWLDAILDARNPDRRDTMVLDAALMAIDAIGPVKGARIALKERAA